MTNTLINMWKKLWRIKENSKCLHTASIESQGLVPLPPLPWKLVWPVTWSLTNRVAEVTQGAFQG